MSTPKEWGTREYQNMVSAERRGDRLRVRFKDGTCVTVEADRLLPADAPGADWTAISVTPFEIRVPTATGAVEIPWSTIRALTDMDYSAHLAAAAEEQARKVGQRLRELRERRGLTGKEVAQRAGITPQSLSRIELGHHDVVYTTLQRILAALGCSLKDLVVRPANPVSSAIPRREQ
jgi:DNA-binding Xre family transcriptional regulator